ncbi:MAG: hypothetical protein HY721_15635 [Planctomycetes bacterium]|nr:hypothetical protein [Planctomycetota bacterium]
MADRKAGSIDWEAHEAEKWRMLRAMTTEETIREFLALQGELSDQLEATDHLYREERARCLARLQERLRRLDARGGVPMARLVDSVLALQSRLERAGIPSMVVGGLAVGVWGEPRLTRDVDVKVLRRREDAARLLQALGPDYKPLAQDAKASLEQVGFAFLRDPLGTRIDILLAETSFDESALARAVLRELEPGKAARVCSAEDLVIYKLISDRPRDRADAESVVRRAAGGLDDAYVERWLRELEQALDSSSLVAEYRALRGRRASGD